MFIGPNTNGRRVLARKERMKLPYWELDYRGVEERIHDFDEVIKTFDVKRARLEASRCLHCKQPAPCTMACPAHNDIPTMTWLVEQGAIVEAARVIRQTSTFPQICGRVCPQEHLCEGACVLNHKSKPVHIGALEAFVADYELQNSIVDIPVAMPTGKKVAVVGGGPSGMACAEHLARFGHTITVFDIKPLPGGLLLYGIPGFKLSNDLLYAKMRQLARCGVKFVNNCFIGKDWMIDDLLQDYDAIYISSGAGMDTTLGIPGEDLPGVYKGTEFLIRANVDLDKLPLDMATRPNLGDNVVVIGGGDTATDCLRSALRLGSKNVTCVYRRTEAEMPGAQKDRQLARQEGAQFQFLTQPLRFIAGENGRVAALECIRMELGEPDESGRQRPIPIEDSKFTIDIDNAVMAIGYKPWPTLRDTTPGLNVDNKGLIVTDDESLETSRPGVFAGGDIVNGPSLVSIAMADGHRAARSINRYLGGSGSNYLALACHSAHSPTE